MGATQGRMGFPAMRTFVAIELPEAVKGVVEALIRRLRGYGAQASWVRPENMHLTLRFFGDIADEQTARLAEILVESCREMPPFPLQIRGTGVFPNARKPSVAWVAAEPLDGGLVGLYNAAENAARAIGLPPDDKAFHPHVTLARIRDARTARSLVEALEREAAFDAGAFEVRGMTLFSSELAPKGPIYRVVREFLL